MDDEKPTPKSFADYWSPLMRPADQATAATLVAIALLAILGHWAYQVVWGDGIIEIDRAEPLDAPFCVQVNRANWPELTLLPGIGETLARRIVEDRRRNGPFHTVDQLQRVKGIGPKTVQRLRPLVAIDENEPDQGQ